MLLDEPIAGIDNENYIRIHDLLNDLRLEGKTIIQIEHNLDFVKSLSDEIFFLNEGKIKHFKDYSMFKNDLDVKEFYLS